MTALDLFRYWQHCARNNYAPAWVPVSDAVLVEAVRMWGRVTP